MRNKLFTLLFSSLLVLFFITSFGQSLQNGVDSQAEYFVNPNPHKIADNFGDIIIEETFGLNQNGFNAGPRSRGNMFECTTARKLIEHRAYLNPSVPTQMWFCVYEGATQVGIYNLVSAIDVSPQGPGEGWYSSGVMDYDLVAGMHYGIWASFEQVTGYWNEQNIAVYPIPASFGSLTGAAGWQWAPTSLFPPAPTQDVLAAAFGVPVAYYQTIVTDDIIPVELMSFTFLLSGNDITLNWQTATETNNYGFEVQRNYNGSFETIGFVNGYGTTTELHSYSYIDSDLQPGVYEYRLKQVDLKGTFRYYDPLVIEVETPVSFALQQNYPNPFNPSTQINYSLAVNSKVTLKVFNLLGETVTTLVNENVAAGEQKITFSAANLNSGVYFYKIDAVGIDGSEFSQVRKMMLAK